MVANPVPAGAELTGAPSVTDHGWTSALADQALDEVMAVWPVHRSIAVRVMIPVRCARS
jgi:hypothetical protein